MHPITLLNTDYKLIEKVLANRLRPKLEQLISIDQKGFMSDRRISCNIRRILDLIAYTEEENLPGVILSMDFEKCFDCIEKSTLLATLEYFNIGQSYKQWTSLIYSEPVACVLNNGYFSNYFKVSRSVKQGGPNSAYYFLLIAEVLAIELQKGNLKGFVINNIRRVLGQYADDLVLYLWGTEQNVNKAIQIIKHFEQRSGFKISYEKTTLMRIGSLCKAEAKKFTQYDIKWTSQTNVLGIEITTDTTKLVKLNYAKIMQKMPAVISGWKKRNLSLIGKVMIVNALIASLFVYKMYVMPTISESFVEEFNTLVNNFLWDGGKPKIKLQTLQASKQEGGLGLINLKIKDQALKVSWPQMLKSDEYIQRFMFKSLSNILKNLIWEVNLQSSDVELLFGMGFWQDGLKAWAKYNYVSDEEDVSFPAQIIWYNSKIKVNGKPILIQPAYDNGLVRICQLINLEGGLLSVDICCTMFNLMVMQYNAIVSALPKKWKRMIRLNTCEFGEKKTTYQKILEETKVPSKVYKQINTNYNVIKNAH